MGSKALLKELSVPVKDAFGNNGTTDNRKYMQLVRNKVGICCCLFENGRNSGLFEETLRFLWSTSTISRQEVLALINILSVKFTDY